MDLLEAQRAYNKAAAQRIAWVAEHGHPKGSRWLRFRHDLSRRWWNMRRRLAERIYSDY